MRAEAGSSDRRMGQGLKDMGSSVLPQQDSP